MYAEEPIYSEDNPKERIDAALALARAQNKEVLVVFGADWCPDCQALKNYLQDPELSVVMEQRFCVVGINIGRFDLNTDLVKQYGLDLKFGIPAAIILTDSGLIRWGTFRGEWAKARSIGKSDFFSEIVSLSSRN